MSKKYIVLLNNSEPCYDPTDRSNLFDRKGIFNRLSTAKRVQKQLKNIHPMYTYTIYELLEVKDTKRKSGG